MLADTFVEAQLGGAVGGQVDEAQLYLLTIFVERIDLPAAGLALQADVFAVAVGVELELTAAEGDFLIAFSVVEGVKDDSRLAVAAVGNARIDDKGCRLGYLEQRAWLASFFTSVVWTEAIAGARLKAFNEASEGAMIDHFVKHHACPAASQPLA